MIKGIIINTEKHFLMELEKEGFWNNFVQFF